MPLFQGLSAFPPTPTDINGRVDVDALATLLEQLVEAGVDSIGLLGSTGIYLYLDHAERKRAVAAAVEAVAGRAPLMVGVGALRTDWVEELAVHAERSGASALLLAPVSYTPLTNDELYGHYEAAANATALPLCVYNNPTTTHVALSDELLGRLSHLPTVRAVKMPLPADGDFAGELGRLKKAARADFRVGYSGDWGAAEALLSGVDAWYSVAAGLYPRLCLGLTRAAQTGDTAAVERLEAKLKPLWDLFRAHGSLRVIYALAPRLGLEIGRPPRPIGGLPTYAMETVEQIADELANHG